MTDRLGVLGIVASPSPASRTKVLVEEVVGVASTDGQCRRVAGLSNLDLVQADGRHAEEYGSDITALISLIDRAESIVLGMPVFRAGMPGSLKNLLDLIPRGRYDGAMEPLRAKPVAVVAAEATEHHFLALDRLCEVLRGFFAAYVPPGVYAADRDFHEGALISHQVAEAARTTAEALGALRKPIGGSVALRRAEPQI